MRRTRRTAGAVLIGFAVLAAVLAVFHTATTSGGTATVGSGRTETNAAAPDNLARQVSWSLWTVSHDLTAANIVVHTGCRRIGSIETAAAPHTATITVSTVGRSDCSRYARSLRRAVRLGVQIGCDRALRDGATGKHPRLAKDAPPAQVFSCPAHSPVR